MWRCTSVFIVSSFAEAGAVLQQSTVYTNVPMPSVPSLVTKPNVRTRGVETGCRSSFAGICTVNSIADQSKPAGSLWRSDFAYRFSRLEERWRYEGRNMLALYKRRRNHGYMACVIWDAERRNCRGRKAGARSGCGTCTRMTWVICQIIAMLRREVSDSYHSRGLRNLKVSNQ